MVKSEKVVILIDGECDVGDPWPVPVSGVATDSNEGGRGI